MQGSVERVTFHSPESGFRVLRVKRLGLVKRLTNLQARLRQAVKTRNMVFDTEPTGYAKTILSDLQGAWQCLRQQVAENPGFNGWERALFHIDEAMSWESVRNLRQMQRSLLLVRNILQQAAVANGVTECLEAVNELMDETLEALARGEIS